MAHRKTWVEKLEIAKDRSIVDDPKRGRMLVPKPLDVDAAIRRIPEGRIVTIGELREQLAHEFGAETTCPLCTGMFIRIAAEATEERGGSDVNKDQKKTPYWRVVGNDGKLNPKLPGGVEAQAKALRREGHRVSGPRVVLGGSF